MKNFIIVFAVAFISALGCKMTSTNSTNSESVSKNSNSNIGSNNSNSKEQTKVSDPTKGADSKEELLNAFKNFRDVPFVTAKSVSTENKETIIEQYSSVNSSYSRKSESGESIETIIFGSETFSRMNSSWEWKKESDAKTTASDSFFFPYKYLESHIPDFDIKSAGEETINGKNAAVYNLTLSKPNPEVPSLIKIWIGKDSGLPLKIFSEIEKDNNLTRNFDFESKVNIARPVVGKK